MFDDKAKSNLGNQNLNQSTSPVLTPPSSLSEPDDILDGVEPEDGRWRTEDGIGGGQSMQPPSTPVGAPVQPDEGPPLPGSVAVPQLETEKIQTMPPEHQQAVEQKSLSGGKKVIIIAVSIILAVALAGAGYWLYGRLTKPLGAEQNYFEPAVDDVNETNDADETNDANETNDVNITNSEEVDDLGGEELYEPVVPQEPVVADTDGDGLTDEEELALGTNVNEPDSDRDKLPDKDEVEVYKTNPLNPDTDGDGYVDGDEVANGYDPRGPGRLLDVP